LDIMDIIIQITGYVLKTFKLSINIEKEIRERKKERRRDGEQIPVRLALAKRIKGGAEIVCNRFQSTEMFSTSQERRLNQYPIPVPRRSDIKLVMTIV